MTWKLLERFKKPEERRRLIADRRWCSDRRIDDYPVELDRRTGERRGRLDRRVDVL